MYLLFIEKEDNELRLYLNVKLLNFRMINFIKTVKIVVIVDTI